MFSRSINLQITIPDYVGVQEAEREISKFKSWDEFYGGYCSTWCVYFVMLVALNIDVPIETILRFWMTATPEQLLREALDFHVTMRHMHAIETEGWYNSYSNYIMDNIVVESRESR